MESDRVDVAIRCTDNEEQESVSVSRKSSVDSLSSVFSPVDSSEDEHIPVKHEETIMVHTGFYSWGGRMPQRAILRKKLGSDADWEHLEEGFDIRHNWREFDKLVKKKPFWKKMDIFSLRWWKGVMAS